MKLSKCSWYEEFKGFNGVQQIHWIQKVLSLRNQQSQQISGLNGFNGIYVFNCFNRFSVLEDSTYQQIQCIQWFLGIFDRVSNGLSLVIYERANCLETV